MNEVLTQSRLVGDVGGTNVRFALADLSGAHPRLTHARRFLRDDFGSLEDAVAEYLGQGRRPSSAVIAVAGPVGDGRANLTNGHWNMAEAGLAAGFDQVRLINDYTALALSVRHLGPADATAIGPEIIGRPDATVSVIGAGTGLGVAALVRQGSHQAVSATEGGHIGFSPDDEVEIDILRLLTAKYGRVSLERILSGPGLTDLHWALGRIDGAEAAALTPEQIVDGALAGRETLCGRTLDRFCAIYGSAAGDIALVYGAQGGVFLGGGIAPRILDWLAASEFRERFEAKGRFRSYMAAIPTRVITHPYAALLGAADGLEIA